MENHQNLVFLSNTVPDQKATKPACIVGPSLARQRNAISDDGPFITVFGSSIPLSTKKERKKS